MARAQPSYTSFLCFSLVLASEMLLWRFLSRIFCSSFFSLEKPPGEGEGPGAGSGPVLLWGQESLPHPHGRPAPPLVHLLQPFELSGLSVQDGLPEPLLSLGTQQPVGATGDAG